MIKPHVYTKLKPDDPIEVDDEYCCLAKKIVEQAVLDWVDLITSKRKIGWFNAKEHTKEDEIADIENFFLSPDFEILTNINGQKLIDFLRQEYIVNKRKPRKRSRWDTGLGI